MGTSVKQLAAEFIGAAEANPAQRPQILRKAARTFAALSRDPRNKRAAIKLGNLALDFAGAASQSSNLPVTDFQQLLRDTAQAWEDLGPEAAVTAQATMNAMALQQGVSAGQDPMQSPRMSIAPASFTQDTTLGRSASIKFNPSSTEQTQNIYQSLTVAFWQGDKVEAQAMTVDVGAVLPTTPQFGQVVGPTLDARTYAEIEYGSDGNKTTNLVIDVGQGKRLTVVGNYVSVIVGMDPPSQWPNSNNSATLTLGASIGCFAAPSQAPIFRTNYFSNILDQGTTGTTPIPTRAVYMMPPLIETAGTPIAAGKYLLITFFTLGGNGIVDLILDYSTKTYANNPIPIPPDAYFYQIFNNLGVGTNFRVPFQLSL